MKVPRLTALLVLCFGVVSVALTAVVTAAVTHEASSSMVSLVERELKQVSDQAADRISGFMYERWIDMNLLAKALGTAENEAEQRAFIQDLKESFLSYLWIGMVSPDCSRVIVGSNGQMEGIDVSMRPWCAKAREKGYVGDLHHPVDLPGKNGRPLRAIDVSFPIFDSTGALRGVVAAFIDADQLYSLQQRVKAQIAQGHPTQSLVVSTQGWVIAGPEELVEHYLPKPLLAGLTSGTRKVNGGIWPDGDHYVAAAAETVGRKDYPGLGWNVVTRCNYDDALSVVRDMRNRVIAWGTGISILAITMALVMARWIGDPLRDLIQAARGGSHIKAKQVRYVEIIELTTAINARIDALSSANAAIEQAHAETKEALTERETLLKEIHHRVKNNLQVIISLLRLQGSRVKNNPSGKAMVQRLTDRVQVIGWLYSKLYERAVFENIEAKSMLEPLVQFVHSTYLSDTKVDYDFDEAVIGFDQSLVLGMLAIETVTNAIQHSNAETVVVKLKHLADHIYEFSVTDDGQGFDSDRRFDGIGLTLSQRMALQLGSQPLEITSDSKGTRARVIFHIAQESLAETAKDAA